MASVVVMSDARIALVTGANQGLGFALAAGLAARMNPDDLVLLTGRHVRRVADAAAAVTTRTGTRSRVIRPGSRRRRYRRRGRAGRRAG